MSHDLEDLIRVVDGRPEIVREVAASNRDLRTYIATALGAVKEDRLFAEALPTDFADVPEPARLIDQRLTALCSPR